MPDTQQSTSYAGLGNTVDPQSHPAAFSKLIEDNTLGVSHRVDPAHRPGPRDTCNLDANRKPRGLKDDSQDSVNQETAALEPACDSSCDELLVERERMLRLHSADLIGEIQAWARRVDERESQLNTRDALLDQRERQFRTWEKFKKQEVDDAIRLTEHLQQEVKDRLKRIVAMELNPTPKT